MDRLLYSFTLVVLLVWKFALSKEDFLSYFLTRSNLWESPRQSRGFTSMNYPETDRRSLASCSRSPTRVRARARACARYDTRAPARHHRDPATRRDSSRRGRSPRGRNDLRSSFRMQKSGTLRCARECEELSPPRRHEYLEMQRSFGDERAVQIENRDASCRRNVALTGRVGNAIDKREDALLDGPVRPGSEPGNWTRRIRYVPARADERCRQHQ